MTRPILIAACLLLFAGASSAQAPGEQPAVSTNPDESPSVTTSAAKPSVAPAATQGAAGNKNNEGTTIIGERESPIGLYITPWHNAAAETDIDRPARLLSVGLEVLDRRVFARQVEYYEALSAAQKSKGAAATTPLSSPTPVP